MTLQGERQEVKGFNVEKYTNPTPSMGDVSNRNSTKQNVEISN